MKLNQTAESRIHELIKLLDSKINSSVSSINTPYIYDGLGSYCIFFSETNNETENFDLDFLLLKLLNATNKNVNSGGLIYGLSGVALSIQILISRNEPLKNKYNYIFNDIDRYLNKFLYSLVNENNFDFFYGFIGISKYLTRSYTIDYDTKLKYFNYFIKWFENNAYEENEGYFWIDFDQIAPRYPELTNKLQFPLDANLGMAHGQANIISFLLDVWDHFPELKSRAYKLIQKSIKFLESKMQLNLYGYYFRGYSLDSSTTKGRLAWCYCDIGIIGLYLKLYRILGQNAHLEMALLIGENSTKIDFNDSGIIDTSICHGLSGLCLIYKKLYEFTGSEIIKTSLESYLNLLISSFEVNINSEFTSPFNLNIERNYGIYEGIIGPRLVLNSFLFEIKTEWDEIFLNL